jgi:predicted lysophospholipase L1 biosynthesis ABC-type transport system permease subunit
VQRRRRDLAVLKTLGFVRGQVAATVAWQTTTIAAVAVIVGAPVGAAVGRWAWTVFAGQQGLVAEPELPLWSLLLLVPVALLLANLVAAIPGRFAARTSPAIVLRAE